MAGCRQICVAVHSRPHVLMVLACLCRVMATAGCTSSFAMRMKAHCLVRLRTTHFLFRLTLSLALSPPHRLALAGMLLVALAERISTTFRPASIMVLLGSIQTQQLAASRQRTPLVSPA